MNEELKRLYKAKFYYKYLDRLTRAQSDELLDINRRIAVLETVDYIPVKLKRFTGPTLDQAIARIRMWGILVHNGFFKNRGNK